jgi:predicted Zn-dependent protease
VSYSWTLETTDPLVSPPLRTSAAFFELIAPADAKTLDTDLSQLDANKPGPVTYHLMRASMYFDRGLVDDAIKETETALAADPGNASLHAILGRLYAETGRTKDAVNELNKAQQ